MLDTISPADALKWAALVFLAGFIGFYGKFLGKLVLDIIARAKGRPTALRTDRPAGHRLEGGSTGEPTVFSSGEREAKDTSGKAIKKAIKANVKIAKKAPKKPTN